MSEENNSGELATQVRRGRPPRDRADSSGPNRALEGRAERIPLGVRKQKLNAEIRKGYVGRWVNDDGDRINQALQGGYTFVAKDNVAKSDDPGNRISRVVGSKASGGALTAYLMEIPEEWYREDQLAKQGRIDDTEALIKRGSLVQKPGEDGAYTKSVKFSRA